VFDWYTKKLNELIQVAQYCHHPVIEAFAVLTKNATKDYLADGNPSSKQALALVVRLAAEQAAREELNETASQLLAALTSLEKEAQQNSAEVVTVNFSPLKRDTA
jgi:hypothetical protein